MNDDRLREDLTGLARPTLCLRNTPMSSRSGMRGSTAGRPAWPGTKPRPQLSSFCLPRATLMADAPPLMGIEEFVKQTLGLPKVTRTLKKVVLDPWAFSGSVTDSQLT